jgi:hypothetical protein
MPATARITATAVMPEKVGMPAKAANQLQQRYKQQAQMPEIVGLPVSQETPT